MTVGEIMPFFALIGFIAVVAIIISFLIIAAEAIGRVIYQQKIRYKQKHRFDKPPLAECYCVDCRKYLETSGNCRVLGLCVAEDWFCWNAEPRVKDVK